MFEGQNFCRSRGFCLSWECFPMNFKVFWHFWTLCWCKMQFFCKYSQSDLTLKVLYLRSFVLYGIKSELKIFTIIFFATHYINAHLHYFWLLLDIFCWSVPLFLCFRSIPFPLLLFSFNSVLFLHFCLLSSFCVTNWRCS